MSSSSTYALITGASSGLGVEFAKLFAKDGIPLLITSSPRSSNELEKLAYELKSQYGIDVKTVSSDLAEPDGALKLIEWVELQNVEVEYLVNNAGFGIVGKKIFEYDKTKMREMLQVNINSLSELVMHFVPKMIAKNRGKILNVSSIAGYVIPHGLEAGYSASKAFVVSFSEGISDDLIGTNVSCTHLAPGPTRTKFFDTAGLKDDKKLNFMYMTPDVVAKQGYDGMMKSKTLVMPGFINKLFKFIIPFSPSRRLVAKISGNLVSNN